MKELLWTVLDPDTRMELTRLKLDQPDGTYVVICREIKSRFNFYHPGQVVLTLEKT